MPIQVRAPKDLIAGLIYVALGFIGIIIASRDYALGSGARMGPGYLPTALSALLIAVGLAALARSFLVSGANVTRFAWKPLGLIVGGTVSFGLLLPRAGLIVALLAVALISAMASAKFRFDIRALIALVALIAFCAAIFVRLLGVPLPLVGSWLAS